MARRPAQYLLVTSSRSFDAVRQSLAKSLRVVASGSGTVEDASAMWFEVTRRSEGLPALDEVRAALTSADCIRGLRLAVEGDGKDLARQIPLLSSCGEGLWREGVLGGLERPEPEQSKAAVEGSAQMPLFG